MPSQNTETKVQEFGERVRVARERKGMSRAQLAKLAGISRPYLWQLEDGRSRPSLDYAILIASALGISVSSLIGEEEREPRRLAARREEGESIEAERPTGELKLFWTLLCARASAVQRIYRYERDFPLDDVYQRWLDSFDRVLRDGEMEDECATQAIEAVKLDNAARMNGDQPDQDTLEEAIQAWREAERLERRRRKAPREAIAALSWNLGNALKARYQYAQALEYLKKVRALLCDRISTEDIAGLYTTLGWTSYYVANYKQAASYFEEAIQEWENTSKRSSITCYEGFAGAYRGLGSTYQRLDHFQEAEEAFKAMLDTAERLANVKGGNHLQLLWGKFRIGSFYKTTGDWLQAGTYLTQADELWTKLVEEGEADRALRSVKTMILNNRADVLIRKGLYDETPRNYLEESLRIGREVGDPRAVAYSHWFLAGLYINTEEPDRALYNLELSEPEFLAMSIQRYAWSAQVSKARVYCELGLREAAESLIEQVHTSRMESPSQRALVLATKAFVYARSQKWKEATEAFEKSIPQLEILPYEATTARLDYVEMLVTKGEFDQAREQLDLARQVADDLGAKGLLERAEKLLQEISASQVV